MGLVASANVSSSEIDPALEGLFSKVGVNDCVMPARVNVIDCTAEAGA